MQGMPNESDEDEKLKLLEENDDKIRDYFMDNNNEYGGVPITKDSYESVFEDWFNDLSLQDLQEFLIK